MELGIVVYDVPVTRKNVYNRLRDKLRRVSVPLTWSVYLTPYSMRDQVLSILKELDEDEQSSGRIIYKYLKFDPSEKSTLDAIVRDEFEKLVKKSKDELFGKLAEAEKMFDAGQLVVRDKADNQRAYLSAALKKTKEARRLATLFEVSDIMEAQFQAMEQLVEARRLQIKGELEKAKEEADKAQEQEVKEEEVVECSKENTNS